MKAKLRSIVSGLEAVLLLLALALGAAPQLYAQAGHTGICEVRYKVWNKDRYVYGPVNAECGGIHSAPFGNWGVRTESTNKHDGHQFDGWCRNRILCDNNNRCKQHCIASWYQWNSCTTHSAWSPPNRDFYNHNNNTQQKTTRGNNHHGNGRAMHVVSCPYDSDGDGIFESGGCKELFAGGYSIRGHRMDLYELDPASSDTLVTRLDFPTLTMSAAAAGCNDVHSCGESRLGTWQGSKTYSWIASKASAKAAIQIVYAQFSDPTSACCDPTEDPTCSTQ